MTNAILRETLNILRDELGPEIDDFRIERAVAGLFFIGVKLTSGQAGSCATPIKEIPEAVCCPSSAMSMPFPGKLHGRAAMRIAEEAISHTGVRRALGIAALNALAQVVADRRQNTTYDLIEGVDAFDAAEITPKDTAVVVGAFAPFLRALRTIGARHWVLEKDPSTLKPIEMPNFRPAQDYAEVIPEADVLLITGTTLINDTLMALLAVAKPTARIVIVGPTVTMVPDAFFTHGCTILGGVKITDPDRFLDILAEGGSGYHFFGKSAQKIVLRSAATETRLSPNRERRA